MLCKSSVWVDNERLKKTLRTKKGFQSTKKVLNDLKYCLFSSYQNISCFNLILSEQKIKAILCCCCFLTQFTVKTHKNVIQLKQKILGGILRETIIRICI